MNTSSPTGDTKRPILELVVNASQAEVWRAVSTTEALHEWFGYDYDDRHGGRPERPAAGLDDEVRAFVEDSTLLPPGRIVFEDDTELTLTADGRHTIVRLVVPEVADATWEELYEGVAEGWRFYLEQLRFWLEAAPKGARRTVYLAGEATGPEVIALVGPGTPWYDASVVTRDGWLISVGADPNAMELAQVNVIVSTYGLDDTAFAAIRENWAARWRATAKNPEVITVERAAI
ncbi:SRPBCC domain-containing protein [Saccharomonospora sp. NPDC046836]|uniref:SRPBCC family protein n=1 Tax=Saccharomonospora sp. NPDC046836 TaxID=3156921 RepID=UPI0034101CB0